MYKMKGFKMKYLKFDLFMILNSPTENFLESFLEYHLYIQQAILMHLRDLQKL
jgi:hypothetical protein